MEVIKDNIVSVLKTVVYQKTLESIVRKDLYSGLYSEEYLYGDGRKVIDQYTTSTICMLKITNLEEINHNCSRKLGNETVQKVSAYIKNNISKQYIFVRYMGPKFVIAFSGVDIDSVSGFITNMKEELEKINISLKSPENEEKQSNSKDSKNNVSVNATLNFAITTCYKGTGMEEVLKRLEQYLDNCDKSENDITCL